MEPEIVMPTPLIKEEDIFEDVVIDLDNYRSIEDVTEEWEIKIFENFKCFFIADNHNLAKLMKLYIKSLKEEAVNILNDDALKSYILRHINFFKLHFVEVGGCFADSYLDSLEEILSIYCNLEVKLLPKKLGNSKNYVKRYKRRISSIIHQLVVLAKHCLLDREERLLHIFMKMNVDKDSEEAKTFFNLLFSKFLAIDPKDKSDLAFCRAYILCQKWKKITEEEEWPKMDKMVYTAYQKTAVSINSNEILRSILLPQNDSVLDLITHKSNDPSVLCEAYFKYIRSETFHELDDLTHLEISESDDEDFLPFDSHDELDDGAFIKAYRTYVKSMKPVSTFYKNQSKQNDQYTSAEEISNPEDSECCIVSVGTSDVNPSDTQIVHELPDDDDISEIIYFIKKDPPSTRKKKKLNKSIDSTSSTSVSTSMELAHRTVRIKEHPICSNIKEGVTIETQTEVDFNRDSRQRGQQDIHKRFYEVLTPPSDQNIEESISELSVYTNIVSPNATELLTPQERSMEDITINDEIIFLSDPAKAINDSQVVNNSVSPEISDPVGILSSNISSSRSNSISRQFMPTSRDITEVQNYTQQSKCDIPSSLSNNKRKDNLTKNINVCDTESDKFLEQDVMKLDDNYIQKDLSTKKQTDLNVAFVNSVNILSDAHRSSASLTSTSTFTEYAERTTNMNQDNDVHENEVMENAESSICSPVTKRFTIETQTESDFNGISQQARKEDINKAFYGILTPPSDQNIEENISNLSVYNEIVNPKNTNQKDVQKHSKDNSTAENNCNPIKIIQNSPIENNLTTPHVSIGSAGFFSLDASSNLVTCSETSPLLQSRNKMTNNITSNLDEIEPYTASELSNIENDNEDMSDHHVDDTSGESSMNSTELTKSCKLGKLANENSHRNDNLFEIPKLPKVKELKVSIPNMSLVVTNIKEKINNTADKKIMFTSPLKITRAGLADFCYFEDTLHKKWQQIRDTNTLDDYLCGPVEKINGVKNCLSLDKAFDIFENTDFRTITPNVTPNTTPTTSSTELTSPAYEEGLDDFRNFYDEKKNREHGVVSPSSSPHLDGIQSRKRSTQNSEEINSNEKAVVGDSVSIPVKRKRIAIDETIREHHQSAIESARTILNPKNPPKGILKKFSSTYLEAKRNTAHILIPRNKICLASLDHYGVSPTDHQLQSKVCVVLEKISKHEITQWLRVSEISRKVRMEKEGYKWYAFECLHFKKSDTSKSKNEFSQTNMPGPSTSGTITQWRTPTGLFPSSFSNKNTVGLPAVYHQSTSQASKGMVDTTLKNDNNDNFNNLSSICDGACCQHIAETFSKLHISIPKIHSASTSTLRNPFRSIESGTEKTNVDSQKNNVVIKFVPVSNIPNTREPINSPISQSSNLSILQYANIPLPQPGNDPMLQQPEEPKPELNDFPMPESHNFTKPQLHDVPKSHPTNFSTIQPTLKPIPKPIVPTPQPTVVPELSEFEKILNMKTLTIPLDLQNLDLRRLSPSPVINSLSPQQVSPNSTFTTDCLLNEELDPQGNVENFPINGQILHNEFINSINVKQSLQSDSIIRKRFNRDSDMSYQDEHSRPIFVDTPLTTVYDKSLQDSLSNDPSAYIKIKRVCEKNIQDGQSYVTIVDIPSNKIVEKLRHGEKNNMPIDKCQSNKVSEIYLHSYNKTVDIPLKRSCELTVQDEQNLNGSVDILLRKVSGEYDVQDEISSNTTVDIPAISMTEKHIQDEQNENMALYKTLDRFSEKCLESDQSCSRAENKPSNRVCEVIPQDEQNCNIKVDKLLNCVSDKHTHIDQNCNTAFEIIPNKVCEEPHQDLNADIPIIGDSEKYHLCKPTFDPTLVVPLNQVCDKPVKGKQICHAPVEISNRACKMSQNDNISIALQTKIISEKHTHTKQRSETLDIPLNIVYERHIQLEHTFITPVENRHNTVPENHQQCEQSNNTVMEISSNKINEKLLNGQQDYNRVVDIKIASNRTCQKPLHYNEAVDVQLKRIVDETLQEEQSYNLPVVKLSNGTSDKNLESKGNYNTDAEIPLNRVCDIPLPGAQDLNRSLAMSFNTVLEKPFKCVENYNLDVRTSLNRITTENTQQEQNYNKKMPSNRVDEGQQCDNSAAGVQLNRACEEPVEVEQTYNTSVDVHNRISELSFLDRNTLNRNDDMTLNRVYEQTYDKNVELSNRVCQKPLQDEQIHSTVVDSSYIRVCNKHLQNEQGSDTAVHVPLNRIYDIPLRVNQNHKTASEISLNRNSKKPLQSKRSYKKIDDSQSKIVDNKSLPQLEQTIKLLSNSNCNNSPMDEKIYNSIANVSLEKDFDLTDASVKTDCKFMEIDEIDTHLPLKKRKLSVANCTDDDSDDDFLGPDLVEEIIKRARSEELQKDDISYPAKPMISIAEVQEKLTEHQQPRVFRTPAEKKEMPPPPPPPQASQLNFLETPKIITEQYNNHTYNNPTINYHMNNVPYTIFSCANIPYFPPIIVPMNSTTTFDMNMMSTPQEQQQQHQPQTTTAPNRAHQSSSTQGTTTRGRTNKKTTEDREKTDAH